MAPPTKKSKISSLRTKEYHLENLLEIDKGGLNKLDFSGMKEDLSELYFASKID